ncbi:hypothetical protein K1719_009850 [Acacia pycnantha]|nr:hypothetical protein K1719_009850 [Acacia pycnantha]
MNERTHSLKEMERTKEAPPPLSEECTRSTKKVRIRSSGVEDGDDRNPDVVMADKEVEVGISYKNKLLNLDREGPTNQSSKEVVLSENDYQISKEGDIPSIVFSEAVREVLSKGMERTLIIKLLGRSITYHDLRARTQALW